MEVTERPTTTTVLLLLLLGCVLLLLLGRRTGLTVWLELYLHQHIYRYLVQ